MGNCATKPKTKGDDAPPPPEEAQAPVEQASQGVEAPQSEEATTATADTKEPDEQNVAPTATIDTKAPDEENDAPKGDADHGKEVDAPKGDAAAADADLPPSTPAAELA